VLSIGLVVAHATTFDYNRDRSTQIAVLDGLIAPAGRLARGLPVRVHISTAPCWAVATGVVVDLVKAGAVVTVDRLWLPYFGSRFAGRSDAPPRLELWFDQPGVTAVGAAPPTATRLGATKDIVLSERPTDHLLSLG
jgi:hypothetical protein